MPTEIGRDEVKRLLAAGGQLVDVMPAKEYQHAHLPGAAHLPLERIGLEATDLLDRDRPVIVYCFDSQ
jgi:rhodanese-related sulfurtransferase